MDQDNAVNNLSRLKWSCRRGMLELDVLLEYFLTNRYAQLSLEDKQLFIEFLTYSDPELFDWLLGQAVPPEAGLAKMADMIRHAR